MNTPAIELAITRELLKGRRWILHHLTLIYNERTNKILASLPKNPNAGIQEAYPKGRWT